MQEFERLINAAEGGDADAMRQLQARVSVLVAQYQAACGVLARYLALPQPELPEARPLRREIDAAAIATLTAVI